MTERQASQPEQRSALIFAIVFDLAIEHCQNLFRMAFHFHSAKNLLEFTILADHKRRPLNPPKELSEQAFSLVNSVLPRDLSVFIYKKREIAIVFFDELLMKTL